MKSRVLFALVFLSCEIKNDFLVDVYCERYMEGCFMKGKWIAVFVGIVMIASTLMGCGLVAHVDAKPINSERLLKNDDEILDVEELDTDYIDELNGFAYDIFDQLSDGNNIFISPYSISLALSMLYNGADEETRLEMAEMLGFDTLSGFTNEYSKESNEYMNANAKHLIEALQDADSKVTFNVANSIWLSKDAKFNERIDSVLLAPVRQYYNADILQVDFREDQTLNDVNKWVSNHTDGMIDPFLERFQDKENLRLFLANAIYFNGKWTNPFQTDQTRKYQFNGTNGTRMVDMMFMREEKYRYLAENGLRGVELPYGDERMVMNVIVPEDTTAMTIGEIYDTLTTEDINQFLSKLDSAEKKELGTLALPKFEMEYGTVNLNKALQELGMVDAFAESSADFGLIGDDLFVGAVSHMAKIQVEEWGTKAAGATGIEMIATGMPLDPPTNFIVDVPFLFLIRDKDTGAIVFVGIMNNID